MIHLVLLLQYISLQAYKLLLKEFCFPSLSVLGNLDAIKTAELLRQKKILSNNIVLNADETYLKKKVLYSAGKYVGADSDGNMYKGVVVFILQGLKQSVPVVVKACPKTEISGRWLAEKLSECVTDLCKSGFQVRGIVSDNHAANISSFNILLQEYAHKNARFIVHPQSLCKTYLFYDNVHLAKSIKNNLLNRQKFVFLAFCFSIKTIIVASSQAGYMSWRNFKDVHEEDAKLKANLRKAPKLAYEVLHPGHNKQNVNLALAIFHDTTIAAIKSYFPYRQDVIGFLSAINVWWKIVNSKQEFYPDDIAYAITLGDGKVDFLRAFAEWLENWLKNGSAFFRFFKQTVQALIWTLHSQADLLDVLLMDDHKYILTARLQSNLLSVDFPNTDN